MRIVGSVQRLGGEKAGGVHDIEAGRLAHAEGVVMETASTGTATQVALSTAARRCERGVGKICVVLRLVVSANGEIGASGLGVDPVLRGGAVPACFLAFVAGWHDKKKVSEVEVDARAAALQRCKENLLQVC